MGKSIGIFENTDTGDTYEIFEEPESNINPKSTLVKVLPNMGYKTASGTIVEKMDEELSSFKLNGCILYKVNT